MVAYSGTLAIILACVVSTWGEFQDEMLDRGCVEENMVACNSGECIEHQKFCDGILDCQDATDENFCLHLPDPAYCNVTHQFLCNDKKRCIPLPWLCNNASECEDGSDEIGCIDFSFSAMNSTCQGFKCHDGTCISQLWMCDGKYDCPDQSDENDIEVCKESKLSHRLQNGFDCDPFDLMVNESKFYKCIDSSFCLPQHMMCNGIPDCKDGSDEGPFCKQWKTMCKNDTCGDTAHCYPERAAPVCYCHSKVDFQEYNYTSRSCYNVTICESLHPMCAQMCGSDNMCSCEPGYAQDDFQWGCYAKGPEGWLFFSTGSDISYITLKSKIVYNVTFGLKQAHGITYDGRYLYWVQTAQGHQAVMRAQLNNFKETKQVIVGIGVEEPGDIAVDYMGGNIYFTDVKRGVIVVCKPNGAACMTLKTGAKYPKFVSLDPKQGRMYWADWFDTPVIMTARMDGSEPRILIDNLSSSPTGLYVDGPNDRLYYIDRTIRALRLSTNEKYVVFEEPTHDPYSLSVFENKVFWTDLKTSTVQAFSKVTLNRERQLLIRADRPIFDIHVFHPVLVNKTTSPCRGNNCSHFCLVNSNVSYVCGCPDDMILNTTSNQCYTYENYRPRYTIVGGGNSFTKIQYNIFSNPEIHETSFDIGRVQAMAYDSTRDGLFVYDGQRKTISYINVTDFTLGVTHQIIYQGLEKVVDLDYDYVTDSLYILDAGRKYIEVYSMRTLTRALVYRFQAQEVPISFCVMPDYGKMLVAVLEHEQHNEIHIDSISLDGEGRQHVLMNDLKGPRIRLRYAPTLDNVYFSDEGSGLIDFMHPEGHGRDTFRELFGTVTTLALTETYLFWTDRKTPRLFWAELHEASPKIRRIEFSIFPNDTQLHVQTTMPHPTENNPLLNHPCLSEKNPCSHVCVQVAHLPPQKNKNLYLGYKCFCPPGTLMGDNGTCSALAECGDNKRYCHRSNVCIPKQEFCDGHKNCPHGEDEEGCSTSMSGACAPTQFQCAMGAVCVERAQACDHFPDCPDGSDEDDATCNNLACLDSEFTCSTGSCILKSWRCDGDPDCDDGSDEIDCQNRTCGFGFYQCRNFECVDIKKRCDGQKDCFDYSDEDDCEDSNAIPGIQEEPTPQCAPWEYSCELNSSICLPLNARCNIHVDCPGGTDEVNCTHQCKKGRFACPMQLICVNPIKLCDGYHDCLDGADETEEACASVSKKPIINVGPFHKEEACLHGFNCTTKGQCIEWRTVCDNFADCFDGSDEDGQCLSACENNTCAHTCQPTPQGPQCQCPGGFRLHTDGRSCQDIDECYDPDDPPTCSQLCQNVVGSFVCHCNNGFSLRSDRRSCKAMYGNSSLMYVDRKGSIVSASLNKDIKTKTEIHDNPKYKPISDFDYRKDLLYIALPAQNVLFEVNKTSGSNNSVTNVGKVTKLAVDWITGNVFFTDSTPSKEYMRVCNVRKKSCARLQSLPHEATIPFLKVDPANNVMFYCTRKKEDVLWSASLSGKNVRNITLLPGCAGLAFNSYTQVLYVTETQTGRPSRLLMMDYNGGNKRILIHYDIDLNRPYGLELFEDHVYFIDAHSQGVLGRCTTFGEPVCHPHIRALWSVTLFRIVHPLIHRTDVKNQCEGFVCSNVCIMEQYGPKCVCEDGTFAEQGICPHEDYTLAPIFNGKKRPPEKNKLLTIVLPFVGTVTTCALCIFYYKILTRQRALQRANYMEVRYQNSPPGAAGPSAEPTVSAAINENPFVPGKERTREFINPIQFVGNYWQQRSAHSRRPAVPVVTTASATFPEPVSSSNNTSDTDLTSSGRKSSGDSLVEK